MEVRPSGILVPKTEIIKPEKPEIIKETDNYDYTQFMSEDEFRMWMFRALTRAYKKARRGKRATVDEHKFELNEAENLWRLTDAVISGFYEPGRGIAFITYHPVVREIFAAPFKDRIIHRFLHDIAVDFWDARLIHDAYSCRSGKGVLFGVKRFEHHVRQVSHNYEKKAYVAKMDIQGYFMSLPRERLMERVEWGLERQFPEHGRLYEILRNLWRKVIFDNPCDGVTIKGNPENWEDLPKSKSLFSQLPGRGLVIGNLSSQLLSNIYLDLLDRFVKTRLKYKHYGRYVDDFFIAVEEDELEQLQRDIEVIREFLMSIDLTMHPSKTLIQEVHSGVSWLGVVVYPWGIIPARRIKQFFREAAARFAIDEAEVASIASYLGHMKHLKSSAFEKELFDIMGWKYRF